MRVAFVENRGKTAFWAQIALRLMEAGHNVGWIVQNPAYAPPREGGVRFDLGFPKATDLLDLPVPEAVSTDRGRIYFEAGAQHYSFYARRIEQALDELRPDVVVGEPTLMHEMLTIEECRKRAIPYLHPTMMRYPNNRFSILDGNTQIPMIGSNEIWDSDRLTEMAGAIQDGRSLPSYMVKPSPLATRKRQLGRALGYAQTTLGWLRGERFNTPSPVRKVILQRLLRENLARWMDMAHVPDVLGPVVLYPLQMQPEANIDVWGRPYSNQVALVQRLIAALPEDGAVAIKANPKPKYEVSPEILDFARSERRVFLLPLDWSMSDAQSVCVGAVTVSGTVGFEAVFGRGRCLSLRHPLLEQHLPEFHAETPEAAVARLLSDSDAGFGSAKRGEDLLSQLVSDSFEGTINEPTYDSHCLSSENLDKVFAAIMQVLAALRPKAIA